MNPGCVNRDNRPVTHFLNREENVSDDWQPAVTQPFSRRETAVVLVESVLVVGCPCKNRCAFSDLYAIFVIFYQLLHALLFFMVADFTFHNVCTYHVVASY